MGGGRDCAPPQGPGAGSGSLSPVCTVAGGVVAQEVLKALQHVGPGPSGEEGGGPSRLVWEGVQTPGVYPPPPPRDFLLSQGGEGAERGARDPPFGEGFPDPPYPSPSHTSLGSSPAIRRGPARSPFPGWMYRKAAVGGGRSGGLRVGRPFNNLFVYDALGADLKGLVERLP